MDNNLSRRGYLRTDRFKITGKAMSAKSKDKSEQWVEVDVLNMAAGGLLFSIEAEYAIDETVCFDLCIDSNVISRMDSYQSIKLDVEFKAEIKYHMGIHGNINTYGAAITEMSQSKKIQLDELILTIERLGGMT
jgi:hypothetical protein